MPTEIQGRRMPVTDPTADPLHVLQQPGDYYGPVVGFNGPSPAVFFLLPTATPTDPKWGGAPQDGLHAVCSPPHVFTEEPDGTLTIRESIGAGPNGSYYWHGYLTAGRWELNRSK